VSVYHKNQTISRKSNLQNEMETELVTEVQGTYQVLCTVQLYISM